MAYHANSAALAERVVKLAADLDAAILKGNSAERRALVAEDSLNRQATFGLSDGRYLDEARDNLAATLSAKAAADLARTRLDADFADAIRERDAARNEALALSQELDEARKAIKMAEEAAERAEDELTGLKSQGAESAARRVAPGGATAVETPALAAAATAGPPAAPEAAAARAPESAPAFVPSAVPDAAAVSTPPPDVAAQHSGASTPSADNQTSLETGSLPRQGAEPPPAAGAAQPAETPATVRPEVKAPAVPVERSVAATPPAPLPDQAATPGESAKAGGEPVRAVAPDASPDAAKTGAIAKAGEPALVEVPAANAPAPAPVTAAPVSPAPANAARPAAKTQPPDKKIEKAKIKKPSRAASSAAKKKRAAQSESFFPF